jgi:hypothetical protein
LVALWTRFTGFTGFFHEFHPVNLVNPVKWLWVCRFYAFGLSSYIELRFGTIAVAARTVFLPALMLVADWQAGRAVTLLAAALLARAILILVARR